MKKLLLNTLLLSFIAFNVNAQQIMDNMDPSSSGVLYRNSVLNKKIVSKTEGSMYLADEFRLANVSGVAQQIMIRYNAMTDMIEVQNEKKEIFSLTKKAPYSTITILPYNNIIKLLNYKTKEGEINGYLVELFSSDNLALYRRDRIVLQKGKEAVNTYLTATPAKYVKTNEEYYLSLKNETAIPMPKNKKELMDIYPAKKEEIKSFLKNHDYSFKDEPNLIEIAKFVSTL